MPSYTDQMGREVIVAEIPQRIVSLVPSQTELLFDLGLEKEVVGLTKFCIHPKGKLKEKTIVGGTKKFRFDAIDELKPDLIIGNKEENYQQGIEQLAQKYPVWLSDIYTFDDALDMIKSVGQITNKYEEALKIVQQIKNKAHLLNTQPSNASVAYLIWQNPTMAAAKHTFIDEMLTQAGFINVFAHLERYPEIDEIILKDAQPEFVFLSSEPFPFAEKHIQYFQEILPQSNIMLVDGEMFSWYGSRLLKAFDYIRYQMTNFR